MGATRLLRMVPVKVMQEAAIQDVAPFLRTITLPFDQELEATSPLIDIKNALDHVGWVTINNMGGRPEGPCLTQRLT